MRWLFNPVVIIVDKIQSSGKTELVNIARTVSILARIINRIILNPN